MNKGLLIWNIVLTVLLIVGFTIGGILFNGLNEYTKENTNLLNKNFEVSNERWEKLAWLLEEGFMKIGETFDEHEVTLNEYSNDFVKVKEAINDNREFIRENREAILKITEYLE